MNKKNELYLRLSLGTLCVLIIGYFVFDILTYIYSLSQELSRVANFDFSKIVIDIVFIVIFYLILSIAIHWKNYFKHLTKTLVVLGISFFMFGSFLILFNSQSQEITDSIQGSIDYLLVGSLEDMLLGQFEISNDELNIEFAENSEILSIHNKNMTLYQAEILNEILEVTPESFQDKLDFSKLFISIIYAGMEKDMPELIGAPITKNQLSQSLEELDYSSIISQIDIESLKDIYTINENAYISLSLSESQEIISIELTNLRKNEVNRIWSSLGFSNQVSYNTKKIISQLLMSQITLALPQEQKNLPISIDTLAHFVPNEIKEFTKYDIFSDNISQRVYELNSIRDDCDNSNQDNNTLCEMISYIEYESLLLMLQNSSNDLGLGSTNLSTILEDIGTKEELESTIENKTNKGAIFLFLSFLFFSLSFLTYYLHFKLFDRELILVHIPYYISKMIFYHFIPYYIITGVFYWLISSDFLREKLSDSLSGLPFNIDIFFNIPIINLVVGIYGSFFLILTIFLVFSLGIYLCFYFILKQKVKQVYE
ncbi:MAG: hypothetical protein PF569_06035 [Candidatus Woesearchaeota archaeon]|jgi:hypothetical protein|nr:hypothetical protein [Candidatus Woesearchaeota archaeon]